MYNRSFLARKLKLHPQLPRHEIFRCEIPVLRFSAEFRDFL